MSQNQSYFWQTTRHNVYLKRSSKYRLMLALLSMLAFSTVCLAEIAPEANDGNGVVPAKEETKMITGTENAFNNNINEPNFIVSQSDQKPDSANTKSTISNVANLGFIHAFIASISVILVSELGDKTFFIAAIMAMRHARLTVFSGAIGALSLMTVLSAVFGMAATIIPRIYTYYISTALFAIFGLKMLKEGYYMKATDAQEELEEVQSDLRKREDELKRKANIHDDNGAKSKRKNCNIDNSTDDFGSRLAANSEMQHRQRKQPITATNNNNHDSESDGESFKQSAMLLPKCSTTTSNDSNENGSTAKTISFNSSPCVAITTVASNNNINHPKLESAVGSSIYSCVESIVEPGTASRYAMDLNAANNFNNSLSKMDNAGHLSNNKQLNGMELKQMGSKNRLDREVSSTLVQDPESGVIRKNAKRSGAYMTSRIFMQAFTMTFLAEWGDRSQLTTIILSAREDVYGVIVGGVLGHTLCTGLAVIGGRMIAQKISVRTVTIIGGIVFLLFAVTSLFMSPNEEV